MKSLASFLLLRTSTKRPLSRLTSEGSGSLAWPTKANRFFTASTDCVTGPVRPSKRFFIPDMYFTAHIHVIYVYNTYRSKLYKECIYI